jgi:UDP-N-acetylglucosamine/UDP-N-acetylgalactosamine diphosphorylase
VAKPPPETIDDLRECFRAQDQSHVFDHWDRLGEPERAALIEQTSRLAPGLPELVAAQRRAIDALRSPPPSDLTPASCIELPEHGGDPARFQAARHRGLQLLAEGRVAVLVVAGGQGTRLGYDGPKGAFPIGPISDRCLFELQAQKIRGLARRIGRPVPWYVMTSPATDRETRALFERHEFFGLDPADVLLFVQGTVPACDFERRLIMQSPSRIFENPNGHGGSLTALASSGALDDMDRRGVDRLFYYQVDNPLVHMADPVYLGFHEETGAEMSCKVIRKADPLEKVGVVARSGRQPVMLEYTELADAQRYQRDERGGLAYWAGNIAIHVFDTGFVRRVAAEADRLLPYHASAKVIPCIDSAGRPICVDEPNGYKLERFVFDALPAAKRICVLEVRAEEDFSPIKNAQGKDSPESARHDLVMQYRGWLVKAGFDLPNDTQWIEIDHAHIDSAEEAATCGYQDLVDAGDAIRVATGMDS